MQIQNTKLAGQTLTLRFATDKRGNRQKATGDARGIFEVPDDDAEMLLSTPGWSRVRSAPPLEARAAVEGAPEPSAPVLTPRPTISAPAPRTEPMVVQNGPAKTKAELAEDAAITAAAVALEAEIAALRTKVDAIAFAELHEVTGVTEDMKLSEMRDRITAELLADEDETPEPGVR